MDKFVADNTDMSDVNFGDVSVRLWECFGQQQNCQFVRERYGDNFGQMGNYRYQDHNVELSGDLDTIKMKILAFHGKNNLEVYLEWEKRVEWIFQFHNYSELKKVKFVMIIFTNYTIVWQDQLVTSHMRNYKRQVGTWDEMKSIMRRRFVPNYYYR